MIGALVDGELSDCGLGLIVRLNFSNLKFGTQFKSSCFRFHSRVIFGVGKIFNGGILHQIPCKESSCAYHCGNQKGNQSFFHALFCDGSLIMLIFGNIFNRNAVRFCQFLRVRDGSRSVFVFQVLVIVAVDFCVQKQGGDMVVRSFHALCKQFTDLNLGIVCLLRFKQGVDGIPFTFKGRQRHVRFIFEYGIQALGEDGKQIDVFLVRFAVRQIFGQLRRRKILTENGNNRLF